MLQSTTTGKGLTRMALAGLIAIGLTGCGASTSQQSTATAAATEATTSTASEAVSSLASVTTSSDGLVSGGDLFTDRDLEQEADTSEATSITVEDGKTISITEEGVYVVSGTATDCTIEVAADESAKVQLVLDGVSITNDAAAAILVTSADKVFVTTTSAGATLSTTGTFVAVGDDNVDGVIYSKSDLVLNGTGTLTVSSSDNGIVGKDDLKVTGGSYDVTATGHAFDANDSIAIADGSFTVEAGGDAFHAENSDDDTLGYIYVCGGDVTAIAASDGLHAGAFVQIDDGTLVLQAAEGIEGTYVQINGGTIDITATDDGINATAISGSYEVMVEFNGGDTTISMGQGDTDAVDANGSIVVNDGTITITANSAFDYDASGSINGGTVLVNGEQVTEMTNAMMGGGAMGGGMAGDMGGGMGGEQMGGGGPR